MLSHQRRRRLHRHLSLPHAPHDARIPRHTVRTARHLAAPTIAAPHEPGKNTIAKPFVPLCARGMRGRLGTARAARRGAPRLFRAGTGLLTTYSALPLVRSRGSAACAVHVSALPRPTTAPSRCSISHLRVEEQRGRGAAPALHPAPQRGRGGAPTPVILPNCTGHARAAICAMHVRGRPERIKERG